MNLVNLVTFCSFVCVLVVGVMVLTLQDMRNNQPQARVRTRMQQSFGVQGVRKESRKQDLDLFRVNRHDSAISLWFGPKISRLRTVAGKSGLFLFENLTKKK